ncbi:cupin domain-containing protein [Mesorhizobium sp. 10J20-29]
MSVRLIANRTRIVVALGLLAGATALATAPASAGECPADQVMQGALTSGETMPKDVTDDVLSAIDLSSKGGDFVGTMLRMRKLVVQPGGVVPWHDHSERAANIYILSGSITEYSSNCKVPIEHKAGEVTPEFGDLAHWWKNNGREAAVLISADLLPPAMADNQTM